MSKIYQFALIAILTCLTLLSFSQVPYHQIDGENCDAAGNSPEWGPSQVNDPINDSSAAGSDLVNYWYDYDPDTDNFCFAFERFSTQTSGPSSTYVIFFDTDCDSTTGYGEYGQGGDIAIGLEWKVNGPWDVIKFTYGENNPEVIGQAFVGNAICGDPASNGRFAEFCFNLDDIILSGYDPCSCNSIATPGVITLAGGSINSEPKDFLDFLIDAEIQVNAPPIADGTVTPTLLCLGDAINYDASLSYDTLPANDPLTYIWDFNYDGFNINADRTDISGSYVYQTTGDYVVLLEVRDSYDCPDTMLFNVSVVEAPVADMQIVFDSCSFNVFYDGTLSQDNAGANNLQYAWDFGDGQTSSTVFGTVDYSNCGTYTIELIVTDPDALPACNADTISQTITFDNEPPVLVCPVLSVDHCAIDSIAPYTTIEEFISAGGTATDNCEITSIALIAEIFDNNDCGGNLSRIYMVTDFCGQTTTCEQSIEINDTEAPNFSCPPSNQAMCEIDEIPAYLNLTEFLNDGGQLSDNCGIDSSSFTLVSENTDNQFCAENITRIYGIQDNCGNYIECTQTILVQDTIPPVIIAPANVSAICDVNEIDEFTDLFEFLAAGGDVTDNCGIDTSTFELVYELTDFNTCPETIQRQYAIYDLCGNSSQVFHTIIVDDTIPPAITCPGIFASDCDISQIPPILTYVEFVGAGGSASDNCGLNEATFTLLSTTTDSLSCPETFTRRYAISDLCGNQSFCDQLIIIDDNTAPELNCPSDIDTQCSLSDEPAYFNYGAFLAAGGTATDNCGIEPTSFALLSEISDGNSCPETIIRTYYIEDLCGNSNTCEQIITVDDDINPILNCPSDFNLVCDIIEEAPYFNYGSFLAAGGTASDNCAIEPTSFTLQSEISDGNTCPELVTRIYYIEDLCGNGVTCEQVITVNDIQAPTFTSPGDLTAVCLPSEQPIYGSYADFVSAGGTASDNCTLIEGSFALQSEVSDGNTCPEVITRIYEIEDQCGNQSTFEQIYTVDDTVDPIMTCPSDLTAVCELSEQAAYSDYASFVAAGGSASDNCGLNESSFVLQSEVSDGNTCPEVITRTYYIEDNCGNGISCEQIITIDDDIAPQMTCPGDLTAICAASEHPVYSDYASFVGAGGSASDNCSIEPTSFALQSEVSDGNTCPETITRTYYIEDLCGNGVTCEQVIVLNDEELPLMTCPGDLTAVCDISEQASYPDLASFIGAGGSASDNCAIEPTSFALQSEVSDGNTCPETVTRIYYVEDLCGNGVTCEQVIVINDEEAPMINCPSDFDLVCDITEQAAYFNYGEFLAAGGSASDNCSIEPTSFTLQSEVSDGNTCPEVVTRTYYIEDLCGNGSTCEQVITINDTEAPVFTSPGDLTGLCQPSEQPVYGSYADFISAGGTASDNCTLIEGSFALQSEVSDGNTCPEVITRIYEIEDQCGNQSTFEQIYTVDDTVDPIMTCPSDLTAVCELSEQAAYSDYASFVAAGGSASDNCGLNESSFVLQSEVSDGNTCPEVITRTYYIEDNCGNGISCEQIITIDDDIAPQMTCPGDLTAICAASEHPVYSDYASFVGAGGSASDNCSIEPTSFALQSEVSDGNTCPETITRTYYIEDLCGNGVTCEQVIVLNDEELPLMTCPGDLTAVCDISEQASYPDLASFIGAGGSASDNCAIEPTSFALQSEVSDGNTCPETVTRIYYVEDLCGNGVTCEQVIVINDEEAPMINCPSDFDLVCDITEQAAYFNYGEFLAAGGSASDNCAIEPTSFTLQSEVSDGNTCPEVVTRTYYIEDLCGNGSTCEQVITINDTEAPVFTSPGDLTGVCLPSENPVYSSYTDFISAGGTASDNCTLIEGSFALQSEVSDGNTCPEVITRIYEIEDQCGNQSTFEQIYTVDDTEDPIMTCPSDLTAVCDISEQAVYSDYASFVAAGGSASDNCGLNESSFALQSEVSDGNTCPEVITRTYYIEDNCGNGISCEQIITIDDDIAPQMTCPGDLTAICEASEHPVYADFAAFAAAGGSASDNCAIEPTSFALQSEVSDGNTCPETITRTYYIEDLCGNGVTCEQVIVLNDEELPLMTCPGDLTAVCDISEQASYPDLASFIGAGGSASDNCAIEPTSFALQSEVSDGNTCPETVTRIYYVEDLCGNGVTCEQVIVINDEEAPMINCPSDFDLVCDITEQAAYFNYGEFLAAGGSASDNCAIEPTSFALQSEVSDGNTCPEVITRTYYIEDLCGNGTTCEQVITVNDTEAPVFTSPGDLTGVCLPSENPVYTSYADFISAGGTASDNCTLIEGSFALQSEVSDGNTCPEVITRIYEIEDQCGNQSTFEQVYTVDDITLPAMTCPSDLTAICDITEQVAYSDFASFVAAGGTASDNCGLNESSFALQSEVSDGNTCPEVITRTYYIEDFCGNGISCEQIIEINDEIAPEITCPGELTAICEASEHPVYADFAAFVAAGGSASDNCAIEPTSFALQSEVSDGNTCPETITRTYYIEDLCGNGVTCEQTIILNDVELPLMTCPGDLTAVCNISEQAAYPDLASFIGAGGSASDNCAIEPTSFALQSEVSDGNSCPETVTRIYYVEDLCGNGVTCEQVIVINDEEAPMINCPSDFDLVCDITEQAAYFNYGEFLAAGGSASDNCDIEPTSFTLQSEVSDGNTCPEVITRTYYIEDLCGNGSTCEQVITVNDTEAPIINSPGDLNGVCDISEHPIYLSYGDFNGAGGSASDNCTLVEASFTLQSEVSDGNTCPETFTRIYEIMDLCGNLSTFSQNVIINDDELPTLTCPENEMAVCDANEVATFADLASFVAAGGFASDNCGLNESTFVLQSEVSDGSTCPETVIRTYYIEDNCGNAQVCQQEIIVNDEIDPIFECPGDLTAICDASEQPVYTSLADFISAGGSASDNCAIDVSSFFLQSEVSDGNTCPETITRTYYIQDLCGNGVTCTQDLVINDEEAPILNCPSDLTATCSIDELLAYDNYSDFISAGGSASDNCEINEFSFALQSEVSDGNTCPETVVRTYYIEDLCGNTAVCEQTIVINDTEEPTFNALPDLTFNCTIEEYPPFTSLEEYTGAGYIVTDNCEIDETSFALLSETSDGNNCPEKISRIYSISDLCGNTSTIIQQIEIIDIIPPTINGVPQQNFNCASELEQPFTTYAEFTQAGGSAFDNCGIVESSFVLTSEVNDGNTCPETITRTYSIEDLCGNVTSVDHVVTINDEIPPMMTCPEIQFARCDISEVPAYTNFIQFTEAGGSASDNCALDESSFILLNQISNGQTCPEVITRIYQIADFCGNTVMCEQEIFINDEEAPIINCPAALTAICSSSEHTPYQNLIEFIEAGGSVSDNCEIETTSFALQSEISDGNTCPETITRTYQISDLCGNVSTCEQTILVNDEIAPVFLAAPDLSASCSIEDINAFTSINEYKAGGGNVNDNCALDQNSFMLISESSDGNTCPEVITRIYTVSDLCGNSSTIDHTITINDLIAPIIVCPGIQYTSCSIDDIPPYSNLAEFTLAGGFASDNCAIDETSFVLLSEVSDGQSCPETITRTYSIKDLCANESSCTQTIIVNDIESPVMTGIEVLNGQCDISEIPPYESLEDFINDGGTVNDNCGIDENSFYLDIEIIGEFTCPQLIGRVYIVSDLCGNTSSFAQSVLIDDTTPPVVNCPPTEFGICSSDEISVISTFDEFIAAGGTVDENCELDPNSFTFIEDEIITNSCPQTINRIYSIADICGNVGTCSQELIINDDVAPNLDSPFDRYGDCDISEHPAYTTLDEFISAGGGASDNCAVDPASFTLLEETTTPFSCPEVTTRIYMVSDYCGNTTTSSQNITINDDVLPEINCPATVSNICSISDYTAVNSLSEFELIGGSVSDNCGIDPTSFVLLEEIISETSCPLLVTRIYQIADNCGNVNTCAQEIIVNDDEAPVILNCPIDITLQCNSETNQGSIEQWLSGFEVSDNCELAMITNNYEDPTGPCEGVGSTIVEFLATDACDNTVTCTATLTIIDTLPPLADELVDVIIDSLSEIPIIDITIVTGVSDDCDAFPTITWVSDEYETNSSCSGDNLTITRTYQVIDCSGNVTDVVQTILMNDDPIVVTVEKNNIICKGNDSGSIDISVEGGTPDYTYDWNIDIYDGQTSLTGLVAGTYIVTVIDANDCSVEKIITISEPSETVQVEISPNSPTLCEGSSIELTNFIEFGTAPYTYEWSFETETSNEETFTASEAGIYSLTVIDDLGCEATDEITLVVIPTVSLDPLETVPGCEYAILPEITGANLSGNESYFNQSGGNGTSFQEGDTIWNNITLFIYDETGTTPNCYDEITIDVVLNDGATIDNPGNQLVCESYILPEITGSNLTQDVNYFSLPNGEGTEYNAGDIITEDMTIYIFDIGIECSTEVYFSITIIEKPELDPIDDVEVCDSYTLPVITGTNLTGNEAYYTLSGGNGTKYQIGQVINSSISLFIYDGGMSCNDEEYFSITIFETPTITEQADVIVCNYYVLPTITGSDLTGNEAYFSESNGIGQSWIGGDTIFEDITLYVFDQDGICFDEDTLAIDLVETPIIDPLSDITTCDYFVLPVITGTNLTGNESYYNAPNGLGNMYNPGDTIFSSIILYIYDVAGTCFDQDQFAITVGGAPDIFEPNPISECGFAVLPMISGENIGGNANYYTLEDGQGIEYAEGDTIWSTQDLFLFIQSGSCSDQEIISITILASPLLDQPEDVIACDSYILPEITGTDLTGSEAYFTQPGGNGEFYLEGELIESSILLYIRDENAICDDELFFNITIVETPNIDDIPDAISCDSYILPEITGIALNNPKYFTESDGSGDVYLEGDVITESIVLFIYDDINDCNDEETFEIIIHITPDVANPQDVETCDAYTLPEITGTNLSGNESYFTEQNGEGTALEVGDIINETTTLYLYDQNNACFDQEDILITINDSPILVQPDSVSVCDVYVLPSIEGENLSGNESYYQFQNGQGNTYEEGDVISSSTVLFIWDISNGCGDETSFPINIILTPELDQPNDLTVCALFVLPEITGTNLSENASYYTEANQSGTQYFVGDTLYNSTTLFIYDENDMCNDELSFNIEILDGPNVSDIPDLEVCVSYTLPEIEGVNLTDNAGYYTNSGGTGSSYNVGDVITENTTIYIYDEVASCSDEEVFTITITGVPVLDSENDQVSCDFFILPTISGTNLSGDQSYFEESNQGGTSFEAGDTIFVSTTIFIYDNYSDCFDEESFNISINATPEIDPLDDVVVCDFYVLPEITGTNLILPIYSDGTGGTGTQYQEGDTIWNETSLYISDDNDGCFDETSFDINFNAAPILNPIEDVLACDLFVLPNIFGQNLTGNQAYYSESDGNGIQFQIGDTITSTQTIYAYDIAGGCSDEQVFNIEILDTPSIDPIEDAVVCDFFILDEITGMNIETAIYSSQPFGNGDVFEIGDTIFEQMSIFIYAENGICSASESFEVIFSGIPNINPLMDQEECNYYVLPNITGVNLTGNEAYYTEASGQGEEFNTGDTIFSSQTIYAFDIAGGCFDEEVFQVVILPTPVLDPIENVVVCDYFILPEIAGTNIDVATYSTEPLGNGNIFEVGDTIFSQITIFVYAENGICSASENFEIIFSGIPNIDPFEDQEECDFYILPTISGINLTDNEAYFTETEGQGTQHNIGDTIWSTIDLFAYDVAGGCFDEEMISIIINATPDIDPISNVEICEFYVLPVITGTDLNNPLFYTQANGQGTSYESGDTIFGATTIFAYDNVNQCSDEISFEITTGAEPTANISGNADLCSDENEVSELTITVVGSFPINLDIFKDGILFETLVIESSPFLYEVSEAGEYTIDNLLTADQCSGTTSGASIINTFESIVVSELTTECSVDGLSFTVSFSISEGVASSYTVNGELVNLDGQDPFIFTETFNVGSGDFNFTIADVNACNEVVLNGNEPNCECETQIGQMDPNLLAFCDINEAIIGLYDDSNQILEDDDVLIFILHDGTENDLGNVIATNNSPNFDFDPNNMDYDVTYYISALVGNAGNPIDLDDPCLAMSSTPVIFYSIPSAEISGDQEDCLGSELSIPVTFEGVGPWDLVYTINGEEFTETGITENPFVITITLNENTTVELLSVQSTTCTGTTSGVVELTIVDDLSAELISETTICNLALKGSTVDFSELIIDGVTNGEWVDLDNSGATGTFPILDFDGVDPGFYTFQYTIGIGSDCGQQTYETVVEVLECVCPIVDVSNPDPICVGESIDLNQYVNGDAGTWSIIDNINPDFQIDADNQLITSGTVGATLELLFTLNDIDPDCPSEATVQIEIDQTVFAGEDQEFFFCEGAEDLIILEDYVQDQGGEWNIPAVIEAAFDEANGTIDVSNINFGTYNITYTVSSELGLCGTDQLVVMINMSEVPEAIIQDVLPLDCDNINTTIDASASTNGSEYVYHWTTEEGNIVSSDSLEIITVNAPGIYVLVITNTTTQCSITQEVEVEGSSDFVISNAGDDQLLTCAQIIVMLDGSESSEGDYIYQWLDGNGNPIEGADGIYYETGEGGTYILMVQNGASGCTNFDTVIVSEIINYPLAELIEPNILTCDLTSVILDGTNSTENDFVNYQWMNEAGQVIGGDSLTFEVTEPGLYTLYIVDSTNMCDAIDSVLVSQNVNLPVVNTSQDLVLDCNQSSGTISASIVGDNNSYNWSNELGEEITNDLSFEIDSAGIFTFEAINLENGCLTAKQVEVSIDTVGVQFEAAIENPCDDPIGGTITATVLQSNGAVSFELSNGNSNGTGVFKGLQAGNYELIASGTNGCESIMELELHGYDDYILDAGEDHLIDLGESVQLYADTDIDDANIQNITWTPEDGTLNCTTCIDPVATPFYTTEYIVTLEDIFGCSLEDRVSIRVDRRTKVYAPNIFSPNDDGVNDMWTLFSASNIDLINEIKVYNRWGEKVWENFDIETGVESEGWNGTFKGQNVNPAVYGWYAVVTLIDGTQTTLKGDVTVVK